MFKKLFFVAKFCASIHSFSQVPSYVPSNGLIGWWPFNGNANDESGNGNNGVVNGAALSSDRWNTINSSYHFNGNSAFIQLPNVAIQNGNNRSTTCWIKTNSTGPVSMIISTGSANYDNGGTFNLRLDNQNQYIGFMGGSFSSGNFDYSPTGSTQINDGNWHFIVAVYENGLLSLYVDGHLEATIPLNLNTTGQSNFIGVSQYPAPSQDWFNGLIDDIGIWNRALTACEISNLYSGQLPNSTQNETAIDTYTWPVNGQTYTQSGTYTTIIPNAAGCDSTITLNLTMNYAGIQENKTSHFSIYPNPTTDVLLIEGNCIEKPLFELIDIEGRVVLTGLLSDNYHTLDLTSIEAGNYILSIEEQKIRVIKN